jgi:hypothetical protein
MSAVLALHLAEPVGWALGDGAATLQSGSLRLTKIGLGAALAELRQWLRTRLEESACAAVAFEAPWTGPRCGPELARLLIGLASVVEMTAREQGVGRMLPANNLAVRRHFLGRGWGRQAELRRLTQERCRALGWAPANDSEAAALALLHWAMHQPGLLREAADA